MVHIMLLQAKGIIPEESEGTKWFCTVALGKEEKKSKKVAATPNPEWMQSFYLKWFEGLDDFVELTLLDKKEGFIENRRIGRSFKNLFC